MRLTRLLLVLALLVSTLIAPDAFAAKHRRGVLRTSHKARSMAKVCEWYDIYCDGVSYSDSCCGNLGSCLAYCDDTCGFSSGTCHPL